MRIAYGAAVVVIGFGVALANPPPKPSAADLALDQRFRDDVARANAEAGSAFERGTAERDGEHYDAALVAYRRAAELAPQVDHPHRRVCQLLSGLGRLDEARAECETALRLVPSSPYDKSMLATVLVRDDAQIDRALHLADEVVAGADVDGKTIAAACFTMMLAMRAPEHRFERMPAFEACAARALAADPDGVAENYIAAVASVARGRWYVALTHLEKARAAGLDSATYDKVRAEIDRARQEESAAANSAGGDGAALLELAAWIAGIAFVLFVALFAVGGVMSRSTERAVAADLAAPRADAAPLARSYARVLRACALGAYVAGVAVIASGAFAIAGMAQIEDIPFGIVWVAIVLAGGMVAATARGLRRRGGFEAFGPRIELAREPRLRDLVAGVAETVGTAAPTSLYVAPGVEIAIVERCDGRSLERALVIGLGALDGLSQLQLCSLVAHELGHFTGGAAIAVRRRLHDTMVGLAKAGAASAFNPLWWILIAYRRAYLGVSLGAARWQETRADRDAIDAYGTASFVAALRHVVTRESVFAVAAARMIDEAVAARAPLPNVYRASIATPASDDTTLARSPERLDGHASAADRIAFAERLAVDVEVEPGDDEPAWALFDRRDELEAAALDLMRARTVDVLGAKADYLQT